MSKPKHFCYIYSNNCGYWGEVRVGKSILLIPAPLYSRYYIDVSGVTDGALQVAEALGFEIEKFVDGEDRETVL